MAAVSADFDLPEAFLFLEPRLLAVGVVVEVVEPGTFSSELFGPELRLFFEFLRDGGFGGSAAKLRPGIWFNSGSLNFSANCWRLLDRAPSLAASGLSVVVGTAWPGRPGPEPGPEVNFSGSGGSFHRDFGNE